MSVYNSVHLKIKEVRVRFEKTDINIYVYIIIGGG